MKLLPSTEDYRKMGHCHTDIKNVFRRCPLFPREVFLSMFCHENCALYFLFYVGENLFFALKQMAGVKVTVTSCFLRNFTSDEQVSHPVRQFYLLWVRYVYFVIRRIKKERDVKERVMTSQINIASMKRKGPISYQGEGRAGTTFPVFPTYWRSP